MSVCCKDESVCRERKKARIAAFQAVLFTLVACGLTISSALAGGHWIRLGLFFSVGLPVYWIDWYRKRKKQQRSNPP